MKDDSQLPGRFLGPQLIHELSRRGEKGMYFSYDEYQELRRVLGARDLRQFLDSAGYSTVVAIDDVVQVANGLRESKELDECPVILGADPTGFFGLIGTMLWYLYQKLRKKPELPTKCLPAKDYNGKLLED